MVDLEDVEFFGACGLRCLVQVRALAETTGVRLYLTGLVTKAVERPLAVCCLLPLFRCYPTLAHVPPLDRARVQPSHR